MCTFTGLPTKFTGLFYGSKNTTRKVLLKILTIQSTGIPRFTLLMWGHTKKPWKQKPINQGCLVVQKGRKIG